jgi:hypothetical protein
MLTPYVDEISREQVDLVYWSDIQYASETGEKLEYKGQYISYL